MYHMRNKKRASWFQTVFTKLSTHWKKCLSQETLSNTLYLRVCFKTVLKFYCADYLVILICTFWSSTSGVGPEILPFSQAAGGCRCSWSTEHTVGNKAAITLWKVRAHSKFSLRFVFPWAAFSRMHEDWTVHLVENAQVVNAFGWHMYVHQPQETKLLMTTPPLYPRW